MAKEQQIVWLVDGDDHDYDMMSQWTTGIYSTLDLAYAAAVLDKAEYHRAHKETSKKAKRESRCSINIAPFYLDGGPVELGPMAEKAISRLVYHIDLSEAERRKYDEQLGILDWDGDLTK